MLTNLQMSELMSRFVATQDAGLVESTALGDGIVNETYGVLWSDGQRYILQGLSYAIPDAALVNSIALSTYLREAGFRTPHFLPTRAGEMWYNHDGKRYRCYAALPGDRPPVRDDVGLVADLGEYVAQVHRRLASYTGNLASSTLLKYDHSRLIEAISIYAPRLNFYGPVASVLESTLCRGVPCEGEARQILHGDLRLNNVLWDRVRECFALIDVDTFFVGAIALDLADLCRSLAFDRLQIELRPSDDLAERLVDSYARSNAIPARVLFADVRMAMIFLCFHLCGRFLIEAATPGYFRFPGTAQVREATLVSMADRQLEFASRYLR